MGIFSKHRRTQKKRSPAKILSDLTDKTLIREAIADKGLQLQLALKAKGHGDIAKAIEEAKKPKNVFNARISELALKRLDDPAYAERFVEDFISSAFGAKPTTEGEETGYFTGRGGDGTPAQQLLEQMNDIEELKQKFGGSGGGLSGMLTPEVIAGVIDLVKTMMTKGQLPGPQVERTYIISIEGQSREVSEQDYKRLVESGQIKPIGMIGAPAPQPATASPPEVKIATAESKVTDPPILASLDAVMIQDYINMPPREFVNRITDAANAGIPYAIFLTKYLPTTNYDDLVKTITPYKSSEKLGKYVEWLTGEGGRIWVVAVLNSFKEPVNGRA